MFPRMHAPRTIAASSVAVFAMAGGALPAQATQAPPHPAPAVEAPVLDVTHVSGVDRESGERISTTTREVGGVPVVTGTADDGTDAAPDGSPAARAEFRELIHALNDEETPGVEDALDGAAPRLGSGSVYDTAVAISQRAYADGGASTVYVTRADRVTDALAAGALADGPVLFVPRTGSAPSNVIDEVKRLNPSRVIALGGDAAVANSVLESAAAGKATSRLGGSSSYETAVRIAQRAFPDGSSEVYLAGLGQGPGGRVLDSPDAAAGGVLSKGPVLPVPTGAAVPQTVKDAIARLAPAKMYALGGTAAVTVTSLQQAAGVRPTGRLGGSDRYLTSAAIAAHAYPNGARVAYLAGGTSLAEAVAGGSLQDGPIIFVPPTGPGYAPQVTAVASAMQSLGVTKVGTLSPAAALPVSAIDAVVSKAPSVSPGPLPAHVPAGGARRAPSPTPAPAPSAGSRTGAALPIETCDSLVRSFRPIAMANLYTIDCADSINGNPSILGITRTSLYTDSEELASGSITISRNQPTYLMKATIAHELAHAYSYAFLNRGQRTWFSGELRKTDPRVTSSDFGGSSYDHMPAEQWARGQANCAGWPDGFNRPAASCSLIEATISHRG